MVLFFPFLNSFVKFYSSRRTHVPRRSESFELITCPKQIFYVVRAYQATTMYTTGKHIIQAAGFCWLGGVPHTHERCVRALLDFVCCCLWRPSFKKNGACAASFENVALFFTCNMDESKLWLWRRYAHLSIPPVDLSKGRHIYLTPKYLWRTLYSCHHHGTERGELENKTTPQTKIPTSISELLSKASSPSRRGCITTTRCRTSGIIVLLKFISGSLPLDDFRMQIFPPKPIIFN